MFYLPFFSGFCFVLFFFCFFPFNPVVLDLLIKRDRVRFRCCSCAERVLAQAARPRINNNRNHLVPSPFPSPCRRRRRMPPHILTETILARPLRAREKLLLVNNISWLYLQTHFLTFRTRDTARREDGVLGRGWGEETFGEFWQRLADVRSARYLLLHVPISFSVGTVFPRIRDADIARADPCFN